MRSMQDSIDLHACGGTILAAFGGPGGDEEYHYCAKCHAFAYYSNEVPSGTDVDANIRAWDDGQMASPDTSYADKIGMLCREVTSRGWARGTESDGTLRSIVETAFGENAAVQPEDIRDIILEAEAEARE